MPTLRKDKRHQTKATINKQVKYFYGSSPEEAEAKKQAAIEAANGPRFSLNPTFSDVVYKRWEPNVRDGLKPQSRVKYDGQLVNHILPILGDIPVDVVDLAMMMKLKASLRHRGHGSKPEDPLPLSNREAYQVLALTKQILEFARLLGLTTREDWKLIGMPKFKVKKTREEFPEDLVDDALAAAVALDLKWMQGPIWAAGYLALSRGELAGLYKTDLDVESHVLRIARQRQRIKGVGTVDADTKSENRDRELNLTKNLAHTLWSYRSEHPVYLFAGSFGNPIKPDRITEAWGRIRKQLELREDFKFHDLRSHAASNLRKLKVPLEVIMIILGHGKIDMTMLYLEIQKGQKAQAMKRLDRSLTPKKKA